MEDSGIDSEDKQSTICDDNQMQNERSASGFDFHVGFRNSNMIYGPTTEKLEPDEITERFEPPNTCRLLQRKLELKVERAKRNYLQYQAEQATKSQTETLIPINRLPIPGRVEQKPLVDYKSASSDDEDDGVHEISFFPAKLKKQAKLQASHELTDTFSIQEMTIDTDSDTDSGSQNLELLLPTKKNVFLQKLKDCFGCCGAH